MLDYTNHIRSRRRFMSSLVFICRRHVILLAVVSFLGPHSLSYANEFKAEKRILVLFPNQSNLPGCPLIEKGITSRLSKGAEFHIQYFIEFDAGEGL
jgi:hypothetical protein